MDISEFCPARGGEGHDWPRPWPKPVGDKKGNLQHILKCKACERLSFRQVAFKDYPKYGREVPKTKAEEKAEARSNSRARAEERWEEVEERINMEAQVMMKLKRMSRLGAMHSVSTGRLLREIRGYFMNRQGFRDWTRSHGLKDSTVSEYLLLGRLPEPETEGHNAEIRHYRNRKEALDLARKLKAQEEKEQAQKEKEAGKAGAAAKVAKVEEKIARLEGKGEEKETKPEREKEPEGSTEDEWTPGEKVYPPGEWSIWGDPDIGPAAFHEWLAAGKEGVKTWGVSLEVVIERSK